MLGTMLLIILGYTLVGLFTLAIMNFDDTIDEEDMSIVVIMWPMIWVIIAVYMTFKIIYLPIKGLIWICSLEDKEEIQYKTSNYYPTAFDVLNTLGEKINEVPKLGQKEDVKMNRMYNGCEPGWALCNPIRDFNESTLEREFYGCRIERSTQDDYKNIRRDLIKLYTSRDELLEEIKEYDKKYNTEDLGLKAADLKVVVSEISSDKEWKLKSLARKIKEITDKELKSQDLLEKIDLEVL